MKVLETGATGFVGAALVRRLVAERASNGVVVAVRCKSEPWPVAVQQVDVGDLSPNTDWGASLQGVEAVAHCAALVHVMSDDVMDLLQE
jgi:uncharacterized protein YbjT (DUF2867 family)